MQEDRLLSPPHPPNTLHNTENSDTLSIADSDEQSPGKFNSNSHHYHRGHLSAAEKERRHVNNLCGYCASPDHATANCPLVARKSAQLVSSITLTGPNYPLFNPPPLSEA